MFDLKDYNLTDEEKNEIIFHLMHIVEEVAEALKSYACAPEEFLSPPNWKVNDFKNKFQSLLNKNDLDFYLTDPSVYFFLLNSLIYQMEQMHIEKASQKLQEDGTEINELGKCD